MTLSITVTESGKGRAPYNLNSDLDGKQTLEDNLMFLRKSLINISKEILRDEQSRGFDKNPRKRIDNRFDRQEEQVRPIGKIEYFAKVDVSFALIKMYEALIERSPYRTGQYRSGNVVFVNGTEVARSVGQLKRFIVANRDAGGFSPNDTIRFINVNPYARRLETLGVRRGTAGSKAGLTFTQGGRRTKSRRTGNLLKRPNGAYYLSYRLFRRQFVQIADFIKFSYIPNGTNGIFIRPSGDFRTTFKKDGRPYLYPSIVLKLSGENLKGELSFE